MDTTSAEFWDIGGSRVKRYTVEVSFAHLDHISVIRNTDACLLMEKIIAYLLRKTNDSQMYCKWERSVKYWVSLCFRSNVFTFCFCMTLSPSPSNNISAGCELNTTCLSLEKWISISDMYHTETDTLCLIKCFSLFTSRSHQNLFCTWICHKLSVFEAFNFHIH